MLDKLESLLGSDTVDTIIEGVMNDIRNGIDPYSSKKVYHISHDDSLNNKVLKPRIPSYLSKSDANDDYYEDAKQPRVCFSNSIEGAINAITNVGAMHRMLSKNNTFYVYIPEKPLSEYKHKTNRNLRKEKAVFDATTTGECWIMEPVKLKLYGVIKVESADNVRAKKSVFGKSLGRIDYKWKWIMKNNVVTSLGLDTEDDE